MVATGAQGFCLVCNHRSPPGCMPTGWSPGLPGPTPQEGPLKFFSGRFFQVFSSKRHKTPPSSSVCGAFGPVLTGPFSLVDPIQRGPDAGDRDDQNDTVSSRCDEYRHKPPASVILWKTTRRFRACPLSGRLRRIDDFATQFDNRDTQFADRRRQSVGRAFDAEFQMTLARIVIG